jgi:hypothetical protein
LRRSPTVYGRGPRAAHRRSRHKRSRVG